ncbi:MAG: phosphatidylserine decarboxylase [Syntrophobacteraceae bacterium]
MEVCESIVRSLGLTLAFVVFCCLLFLYWRYIWFFRNPSRTIPREDSGILSPADGTVVYVKEVYPGEDVITVKRGVTATLKDITREDISRPKILVGIFMSPFNVHFNRTPVSGRIRFIHHYPALTGNACMAAMHLRTVLRHLPLYKDSIHIVQNERTVTKIDGEYRGGPLSCYVVQIAAKSVAGIDSYVEEGERVRAGQIFGMIRIGSQVDLVFTPREGMKIKVCPGTKVRAGETILVE